MSKDDRFLLPKGDKPGWTQWKPRQEPLYCGGCDTQFHTGDFLWRLESLFYCTKCLRALTGGEKGGDSFVHVAFSLYIPDRTLLPDEIGKIQDGHKRFEKFAAEQRQSAKGTRK